MFTNPRSFSKLWVTCSSLSSARLGPGATITMISGAGAARPPKETSLAAASNASIVAFAKAMAVDLAPVRVNVVMPGVVDTGSRGAKRESPRAWAEKDLPARRFGTPDDIANAIVFLVSSYTRDASSNFDRFVSPRSDVWHKSSSTVA